MPITVYRSDDASAPVLTSAAGSLVSLLDACLIDGYGAKAEAGWSKAFSATQRAAYRAPSGNRFYLYIDDTPLQFSVARGYRAMTSIDVGTGDFPTIAQLAGGIRPVKSSTTDSTARPWVLIAGTRAFYLWIGYAWTDFTTGSTSADLWCFGDIVTYLPGDAMHTILAGRPSASTGATTIAIGQGLTDSGADMSGHYLASSYLQDGNGYPCGAWQTAQAGNATLGASGPAYPDPITGGLLLDNLRICEGGTSARLTRGHFPGLYNPLHDLPGQHLDTLSGTGAFAGKTFLMLYKGGTAGRAVISLDETDWLTPS